MCVPEFIHVLVVFVEARRECEAPETAVTGSFEPPNVGAENETQAFCKSSKCC